MVNTHDEVSKIRNSSLWLQPRSVWVVKLTFLTSSVCSGRVSTARETSYFAEQILSRGKIIILKDTFWNVFEHSDSIA